MTARRSLASAWQDMQRDLIRRAGQVSVTELIRAGRHAGVTPSIVRQALHVLVQAELVECRDHRAEIIACWIGGAK